ncbi:poly(A)-binding protein binding protein [Rhizina undulata]
MATTATAASPAANAAAPSAQAGGRPQLKGSITGGAGGNARRSVQSPMDGGQRRNSPKVWQTNNPQQQKYNGGATSATSSPTPSQASTMKARTPSTATTGESDTPDKHMHDRTLYLLSNLMGRNITLTLKTGARFTGILSGADPRHSDLGVAVKWARQVRGPFGDSGEEKIKEGAYVGGGPEKAMIFEQKDLVDIFAEKVVLGESETSTPANQQNGTATTTFRTDADISGNLSMRERELHRWQPDGSADNSLSLEESANSGQGWNQFEANERLFGVKSQYDENIYTTKVDRSHPLYEQREAAAAKIAREIEGQTVGPNMNTHVAEERGLSWGDDSGMDEEDNGVQRGPQQSLPQLQSNNPARYTPPALRAPTSHPTVPGAPHDPAIIASQLVRPETLQKQQQPHQQVPRPALPQITLQQAPKVSEETTTKPTEKPGLPESIVTKRAQPLALPLPHSGGNVAGGTSSNASGAPHIEQAVTEDFKQFVHLEKERYKKKKADIIQRDMASKLKELKRFSETFTLKSPLPTDLVPILAKDKSKQAEIVAKANANAAKAAAGNIPIGSAAALSSQAAAAGADARKALPVQPAKTTFASKYPEEFAREKQRLMSGLSVGLSGKLQDINQSRRTGQQLRVKSPQPIPEFPPRRNPPTGPSSTTASGPMQKQFSGPFQTNNFKKMNATAMEFKPNPHAVSFTPTLGGPSTNASPSPTVSHAHGPSRTASPSMFFGNKKAKVGQDKPSIYNHFNPFKRMKITPKPAPPVDGSAKKLRGNSNDYIDLPFSTLPMWPTTDENKDKTYVQIFEKVESAVHNSIHSPQPPHIIPHQPHHQQLPPHMPHLAHHPPHMPHQPHHPHIPQQHLGIPPTHYEQDQHMRQIPSVMPSPALQNASVAPYQQSPVPHHSQLMYPPQAGMVQFGIPGGPGGPPFGYYATQFQRGPGGAPMAVHGPHAMAYPAGQMGGQFMHHPQMYSPQQPHAFIHGPPPPSSQGYPSPGRGAPMMMHQGSTQGTPSAPQMVPYAIQPGQGGPMYAGQAQQQQQSELLLQGQNWLPQRPQSSMSLPPAPSTPAARYSRAASPAVPSPRPRHSHMSPQPSAAPLLVPFAAFSPVPPAPVSGLSSTPLQRSQTNTTGGAGGRSKGTGGNNSGMNVGVGAMIPSPLHPGNAINSMNLSNDGSFLTVGGMMGRPPPSHQGGPPQFYHAPQGHYPASGRGNGYGGPAQQQGQHAPPPPQPQPQVQPPSQQTEGDDGK